VIAGIAGGVYWWVRSHKAPPPEMPDPGVGTGVGTGGDAGTDAGANGGTDRDIGGGTA